jgi:hypothetical protein
MGGCLVVWLKARQLMNLKLFYLVIWLFVLAATAAKAHENPEDGNTAWSGTQAHSEIRDQFDESGLWLSIGAGVARFDTNYTFTNKSSGLGGIIDAEGTLGMPEIDTAPFVMGGYAFNSKHSLEFSYWRINRSSDLLDIDKNFGDVSVEGDATLTDKTRFFYLNYGYALYRDPRALVRLRAGLYGIDLEYEFNAIGSIEIDGMPVGSGVYNASARQLAPLPLVGIDFWFRITPRWSAGSSFGLVGGTYKDISANIFDASITTRYALSNHWGLNLGANFLSADIEIDGEDVLSEISYGFEGLSGSVDYQF